MEVTFGRLGDAALTVRSPLALALHDDLQAHPPPGFMESVPALDILTVFFDRSRLGPEALEAQLRLRLTRLEQKLTPEERLIELQVRYDGPDLESVAGQTGLSPQQVTDLHAQAHYRVAFLGFLPGFAYLSGLPPRLHLPRLATPRERVGAGSVAIGGPWAGVYPLASPGGWHVLGHTSAPLFDPAASTPVLLRPGDRVRFRSVT